MKRAVPTTEKSETEQTKRRRLPMEHKDIKDLEMIEKEVPEGKQANAALGSLKSNESSSSAISKTEKMAADTEQGTYTHNSATENVQEGTENKASPQASVSKYGTKLWTCDVCQLKMYRSNLNSHLQGKKHKAANEALNTKTIGTAGTETGNGASPHVSAYIKEQKIWTCDICQLTMFEGNMNSHLQGKKHKAASEARNTKTERTAGTDTENGASPRVSAFTNVEKTWTCDICQRTMLESSMNFHLQGKKHKAICEALNVKS